MKLTVQGFISARLVSLPPNFRSLQMENSDQVYFPSTTSNLSVPSISYKSDENDHNYPPSIANLNSRKLVETQKIVKKKVVTERNEAMDLKFCDNPSSEIPNVDLKPFSCKEDSEKKLPYDPLTNYLSPRPKFLRYKPSRRLEIFLRRVGEENSGIGGEGFLRTVREDSLLVPYTSSPTVQEKEKLEEESEEKSNEIDEEIEDEGEGDEEEHGGWTVKELLKLLLVIASLVLCTAYITSMNTPTPSFEVPGIFRSGVCSILNRTAEFGSVVESLNTNGTNFGGREVTEVASEGVSQFSHQEDAKNGGFVEETEILNGENESGQAGYGDIVKVEYSEQVEEETEKALAGASITEEMAEGEENGVEVSKLIFEDDGDQEKGKESEISNTRSEENEITDASNINGFDEDKLLSDILTAAENEYTPQIEAVEKEEAVDWEMVESNAGEAESFVIEASKITILERITNSISRFVEDFEKLKSELIELMLSENESLLKVVFGLSVSSAILTCLVLSFPVKKEKDDKEEPSISVSVEPLLRSPPVAKAEKVMTRELPSINPPCDVDRSNNEPLRNLVSFKMLSSSIHSRDEKESLKEIYHQEAPTVQLLGEFVVGDITNSLKNKSGLKNRTIEAEDSNFPISVEEKPVSKKMNSGPEQALSEFSATSSPTYGSFTSKKKIVKKEVGGGDGEVKSIPTPVRRSTRIRNRIVSP